jgi:hypothetical protein
MTLAFSQTSGEGLVRQLFAILIIGICCAIIWYLGRLAGGKMGVPPMGMASWNGLFILVAAIFVINFLMGLAGHPFIVW